jgi:hypothetical protein
MGSVIGVTEDQLPRLLDLGERRIRRAVASGALAGAHRGRAVIVKRTPVDRGPLKAGWRVKPGATEFFGPDTTLAELRNDAPHLAFVEIGTRPHAVSPEGWLAIYEWVRRHFRGGELGGRGRMRKPRDFTVEDLRGPFRGPDPVISRITNAIVMRIRRKGTKPTFFVRNSIEELQAVMVAELLRAIGKVEAEIGGRR